jgi:phage major head subunit gpT-like protein
MLLNRQTSQILFTGYNAQFQSAFASTEQFWKLFATEMPSGTETELYHWIAQLPGMREFVGPRLVNNVPLRDYTLTNKIFEGTIGLDKWKVKNDTHGAFSTTAFAFGESVARWPDEQMAAAIEASISTVCYDSQYFFDTDHPYSLDDASLSTYSNLLTGAAYDLSKDPIGVWQAASELMATYKGDSGKPLGLVADTLMVPPQLRRYAMTAGRAELVPQAVLNVGRTENIGGAGVTNVYKGDFTIIVNPYLTTQAAYVMCTKRAIKPFVWQIRENPVFVQRVDPTDPVVFNEREFVYGCEAAGVPGYSLPFLAVRCAAA